MVQFDKLTGYLKRPLFEELALAIFGITLPPWFYEGDAVGIETVLTQAGRGRLPSWPIIFRTNTLSGRKYSYTKNFLGSAKDQTPGYYQLGYFMTTKLRRDHGKDILDSVYTRMKRNPFRPYNLSSSIKYFTGMNTRQLHDATVRELDSLWTDQQRKVSPQHYEPINERTNETPTDYLLPTAIPGRGILSIKRGKASAPVFILIDSSGKEKKVLRIGSQEEPHFSYANGKITWDETRLDARFHKRSFNVVNIHDLNTRRTRQITHRTRLFAPSLSPDANVIAAIDISYSNQVALVELDAMSGREIKRYPNPENYMLQMPRFNATGDKIVLVAVTTSGKTLLEVDRRSGSFTRLMPFQLQQISRPVYIGNDIIFKAHYNGLDNIYKVNRSSKEPVQLTSAPFGAFNPSPDSAGNRILINNYQLRGMDISSFPIGQAPVARISAVENTFINYSDPLQVQERETDIFSQIPNKTFQSKRYREIRNLFYFHSASLIAEDNEFFNDYNFGLTLRSNNHLNTMEAYAGYRFNNALKRGEYLAGLTYKRFFPILNLTYLNQARQIYQRRTTPDGTTFTPITWRENVTEANVSVPLSFNRLNHNYSANVGIGTSYTSRYDVFNRPRSFIREVVFPAKYSINLSHSTIRSPREFAPRWGQSFNITYRHLPFDNLLAGEQFIFKSRFYFPGIAVNHTFQASFNTQYASGVFEMNVDIPHVRGYHNLKPTDNFRNTLVFDYRFPIFYPDWRIGNLAYIKRLRGGLFSDFENVGFQNASLPRTYGVDMQADMNLLRFYLPNFAAGGRIIFTTEKSNQNPIFEVSFAHTF